MADDKDLRMDIEIGASTNEKQIKKETKKAVNAVGSVIKDGRIEIDLEIANKPIKGLEKEQNKILNMWKKVSEKGGLLSAPKKDVNEFLKSYSKFSKMVGQSHKGNSGAYKEIDRVISKQIDKYKKVFSDKNIKQTEAKIRQEAKARSTAKREAKISKKENDKFIKDLSKGTSAAKSRVPGSSTNLGMAKQTPSDKSLYTTEESLRASEISAYKNNSKIVEEKHRKEEEKETRKNTKKWREKDYKLGSGEVTKGHIKIGTGKGRKTTDPEQLKLDVKNALNDLAKLFRAIEKGIKEVTDTDILTALDTARKTLKSAGHDEEGAYNKISGKIQSAYDQSMKKQLGGTTGEAKGVGPGHKEAVTAQKRMNKALDDLWKTFEPSSAMARRYATEEASKSTKKGSQWSKRRAEIQSEGIDEDLKKSYSNIKKDKKQIKGAITLDNSGNLKNIITDAINNTDVTENSLALYRHFNKEGRWVTAGPVKHIKYRGDKTDYQKLHSRYEVKNNEESKLQISKDLAFAWKDGKVLNAIKRAFNSVFKTGPTATDILSMSREEQEKLQAERIAQFGLSRPGRLGSTGDKADIFRRKSLYWRKDVDNPFRNLKLTEGIGINSKAIANALQKNIEKNMFTAQTGGVGRNILGAMTGYIGMPSLEKSRAEADAANQILSNIRNTALELLSNIQEKETALRGLEKIGQAKFDSEGKLMEGSSTEAFTLFARMEEQKQSLTGVLAEAEMLDELVSRTGGKLSAIFKRLGFVTPELRENNQIIQNINAGLTKTGKALKFQTRTGEVLNYSLQLMARSVGRMWVNWMKQLNPITQIKKAFKEFMGYNTKWQRTMNVIKYNIHGILEPFMDKIAQFLINGIGFIDIISMKIQKAFGAAIPISLFDQAAADTQKMKEELEAAANVSAGFDELHDIGSDNSGANDLMGEIYKPQLPKEWEDFANKIGDWFASIIPNVKNIGEYITTHWKKLLKTLLGIFLGWQLLKIGGKLLANALFGNLAGSAGVSLFSKIGTILGKSLYTGMAGSTVTLGKFLGGALLAAGGTYGAFKIAGEAGRNWQDMATSMKVASVAGGGLMSVMTGLGAVMLGASGPVGWAIAGTVALASLTYGMAQTQDGIGSVKKETENLQKAQENAKIANDNYLISLDNLAITTSNLEQIERETGLSGEKLAEQVKNGELSIDDMTAAQIRCYNAYVQNEEMIKQNKKALEEKIATDKQQVLSTLKLEAANAVASDSYDGLLESVTKAMDEGSISAQEGADIMSRALANASEDIQTEFRDKIPDSMKSTFDPDKYESAIRKLGNWFKEKISAIKNWWNSLWGNDDSNFSGGGRRRRRPEAAEAVVRMYQLMP